MQIEAALYYELTNSTDITDIVSTRIYPLALPQQVSLPAISYFRVTGPRYHGQGTDPGVARPLIQISCWGESYSDVREIAEEIRKLFQDFAGTMGGAGGVEVLSVSYEGDADFYEDETKTYHIALDFIFNHIEERN